MTDALDDAFAFVLADLRSQSLEAFLPFARTVQTTLLEYLNPLDAPVRTQISLACSESLRNILFANIFVPLSRLDAPALVSILPKLIGRSTTPDHTLFKDQPPSNDLTEFVQTNLSRTVLLTDRVNFDAQAIATLDDIVQVAQAVSPSVLVKNVPAEGTPLFHQVTMSTQPLAQELQEAVYNLPNANQIVQIATRLSSLANASTSRPSATDLFRTMVLRAQTGYHRVLLLNIVLFLAESPLSVARQEQLIAILSRLDTSLLVDILIQTRLFRAPNPIQILTDNIALFFTVFSPVQIPQLVSTLANEQPGGRAAAESLVTRIDPLKRSLVRSRLVQSQDAERLAALLPPKLLLALYAKLDSLDVEARGGSLANTLTRVLEHMSDDDRVHVVNFFMLSQDPLFWRQASDLLEGTPPKLLAAFFRHAKSTHELDVYTSYLPLLQGAHSAQLIEHVATLVQSDQALARLAGYALDQDLDSLWTQFDTRQSTLPQTVRNSKHKKHLTQAMQLFGLDINERFAQTRDQVTSKIDSLARVLCDTDEERTLFSTMSLVFYLSKVAGSMPNRARIKIENVLLREAFQYMNNLPRGRDMTIVPNGMVASLAKILFGTGFGITGPLPRMLVQIKLIERAAVHGGQFDALVGKALDLSTAPRRSGQQDTSDNLFDIEPSKLYLLAHMPVESLQLFPSTETWLLPVANIVLLHLATQGSIDVALARQTLDYNARNGDLSRFWARMYPRDAMRILRLARQVDYSLVPARDAPPLISLVEKLATMSQDEYLADERVKVRDWIDALGEGNFFKQCYRLMDPDQFAKFINALTSLGVGVSAESVLMYPGPLKTSFASDLLNKPAWQQIRATLEERTLDIRPTSQAQVENLLVLAATNGKLDSLAKLISLGQRLTKPISLQMLLEMCLSLPVDNRQVVDIVMDLAQLDSGSIEKLARQLFSSRQTLQLPLLYRLVTKELARKKISDFFAQHDTVTLASKTLLKHIELAMTDATVPMDLVKDTAAALVDIVPASMFQELATEWITFLASKVVYVSSFFDVAQATDFLMRAISLYVYAWSRASKRRLSVDIARIRPFELPDSFFSIFPMSDSLFDAWRFAFSFPFVRAHWARSESPSTTLVQAMQHDCPRILDFLLDVVPAQEQRAVYQALLTNCHLVEISQKFDDIARVLVKHRHLGSTESIARMTVNLVERLSFVKLSHFYRHGLEISHDVLAQLLANSILYSRMDAIEYLVNLGFVPTPDETAALFEVTDVTDIDFLKQAISFLAKHGAPVHAVPRLAANHPLTDFYNNLETARRPIDASVSVPPRVKQVLDSLLGLDRSIELEGITPMRVPLKYFSSRPSEIELLERVRESLGSQSSSSPDPELVTWLAMIAKARGVDQGAIDTINTIVNTTRFTEPKQYTRGASCIVCGDDEATLVSFFCDPTHAACYTCWFHHAKAAGAGQVVRCVAPRCHAITRSQIRSICQLSSEPDAPQVLAKCIQSLNLFFPDSISCPSCKQVAVQVGSTPVGRCVNTRCLFCFCVLCAQAAHPPFSCNVWRAHLTKAVVIEGVDRKDMFTCPECGLVQEKVKGTCNKVRCGVNTHATHGQANLGCKKAFCFKCRKPWKEGKNFYVCQEPVDSAEEDAHLAMFFDMAQIDKSDERLATFETLAIKALANQIARERDASNEWGALLSEWRAAQSNPSEVESFTWRVLVPIAREQIDTRNPHLSRFKQVYRETRAVYKQLMMLCALVIGHIVKYYPQSLAPGRDDAQVRVMRAFCLNMMQHVQSLWGLFSQHLVRDSLAYRFDDGEIETLRQTTLGRLQECFLTLEEVLADPECAQYVDALAAQIPSNVQETNIDQFVDRIADFLSPHCISYFDSQRDSIAQKARARLIKQKADSLSSQLDVSRDALAQLAQLAQSESSLDAEAVRLLIAQHLARESWGAFCKQTLGSSDDAVKAITASDYAQFCQRLVPKPVEVGDILSQECASVYSDRLEKENEAMLTSRALETAMRGKDQTMRMFPFDLCLDMLGARWSEIEHTAAAKWTDTRLIETTPVDFFLASSDPETYVGRAAKDAPPSFRRALAQQVELTRYVLVRVASLVDSFASELGLDEDRLLASLSNRDRAVAERFNLKLIQGAKADLLAKRPGERASLLQKKSRQ